MANYVIIGSDECKSTDVASTMLSNDAATSVIRNKLSALAMHLGLGLDEINTLSNALLFGFKSFHVVLAEILTTWHNKKPEEATLATLVRALKACELNLTVSMLEERFLTAAAVIKQEENQYLKNVVLEPVLPDLDFDVLDGLIPRKVKECFGIRKRNASYPIPSGGPNAVLLLSIKHYFKKSPASSRVTVDQRDGAWEDCEALKAALMKRGYREDDIQVENDPNKIYTKDIIIAIIESFRDKHKQRPIRSLIVFLGDHGFYGFLQSCILENIDLYNEIIYKFNSTKAPGLISIPKVFIFQACQGMRIPEDVPNPLDDAGNASHLLPMDNTMICLATLPGYPAIRDPYGSGSAYVLTLVDLLNNKADKMDLTEMLEEAKRLTAEKADAFARETVEILRNQNPPVEAALKNRFENFRQVPINYSIGTFGRLKFVY